MLAHQSKIQQARTVIKDKFLPVRASQSSRNSSVGYGLEYRAPDLPRHGWPVKIPFFSGSWISLSNVFPFPRKNQCCTVGRCTEMNSPAFCFLFQFPENIPFRSHVDRVPIGKITPVHLKSIMMFRPWLVRPWRSGVCTPCRYYSGGEAVCRTLEMGRSHHSKKPVKMKAVRKFGHSMDLTAGRNGVPASCPGVQIRQTHSTWHCTQVFPLYGWKELVPKNQGRWQGAGSMPSPGAIIF